MEFKGSIEEFRKHLGLEQAQVNPEQCPVDVSGKKDSKLIEELFAKSPCIMEYPDSDDGAMVVMFPSGNVYGVGGCEPYTTLQDLCEQHWNAGVVCKNEINFVNQLEKMLSAKVSKVTQSYQVEHFVKCYKTSQEFDDGFLTQNKKVHEKERQRQLDAASKEAKVPTGSSKGAKDIGTIQEKVEAKDVFVEKLESDMNKYLGSVLYSKPKF